MCVRNSSVSCRGLVAVGRVQIKCHQEVRGRETLLPGAGISLVALGTIWAGA